MNTSHSPPPRLAVAVSGGADSLYTLLRLREQGHSLLALHGVFLEPEAETEDKNAAMRRRLEKVCRDLDVPLHIQDCSAAFSRLVVRPFVESYARGLTPNPCALCNRQIKFGLLLETARSLGAQTLATGHYARVAHAGSESDPPALFQARDQNKDQSYFLALTPAEALQSALFPLEGTCKQDVLAGLARLGITPPQPEESQEVCFVPGDQYRDFLPRMAARWGIRLPGPGPALLQNGQRVGTHQGLWRYTEGQRKGLGIGWSEPLHVLAKEHQGNVLRLGPRREMGVQGCRCAEVNILLPPDHWPQTMLVKTRYREQPRSAQVSAQHGPEGQVTELRIIFDHAYSAIAPGQIAALYLPGPPPLRLVAGGIITEPL